MFGLVQATLAPVENPPKLDPDQKRRIQDDFKISKLQVILDGDPFMRTLENPDEKEKKTKDEILNEMWQKADQLWTA